MSETNIQTTQPATLKTILASDQVVNRLKEILGKRAATFTTSVLQIVQSSELLKTADPQSVLNAAMVAATLDLPLNNNLGFAWIVPYNGKGGCVAQFQLGYKGFIQLALRSGQFNRISSTPVYEGQLVETNPLTGHVFDFSKLAMGNPIGYAAYFRLVNGFEATLYLTIEELNAHGKKYSQSFKKGYGLWKDDFDAMANKTVLKLLLSKFAPLSVDMQKAVEMDQAVVKNEDATEFQYVDNEPIDVNKELERAEQQLAACTSLAQVEQLVPQFSEDIRKSLQEVINDKRESLISE